MRSRKARVMRLVYRYSEKFRMARIPVAFFLLNNRGRISVCQKIEQALRLIAEHDPLRFARLRRDVRRILIFTLRGFRGRWFQPLRMCVLDRGYLLLSDADASEIASTIVHEATHARLMRAGFNYDPEIRHRVERLCFKAEIAFGKRVPNGLWLIARAEAQLARDPHDWTDEALLECRFDWLQETSFANWFFRLRRAWMDYCSKRGKSRINHSEE
jgi:hypothetical protein